MPVKLPLLLWLWRQTLPATVIVLPVACLGALLTPGILHVQRVESVFGFVLPVLVLVHAVAITYLMGRAGSGAFAFAYTRGFSRHRLWLHTLLATAAAVLTVWLPVGLIVWTPLRSLVQDGLFKSPYYPGAAFLDRWLPLQIMAAYALLLPVFHYAWIRLAHPSRGRMGGVLLAAGFVCAAVVTGGFVHWSDRSTGALFLVLVGIVVLLLLTWSWRLHRRVEVG